MKNKFTIRDVYVNKVYNKDRVKDNILNYKKEGFYMNKYCKYGVGLVAVILVLGLVIYSSNNRTIEVDYARYLAANKPIQVEKNKIQDNISKLYNDYSSKNLTDDEYFNELDRLNKEYSNINKKEMKLKKEYKLDKELNLDKIKFSDDPTTDKKLKEIYQLSLKLEEKDKALDIREDQLEKDYKTGKISKEEYIIKKDELEKEDEALDLEEDKLDALEDQYDIEDDDDLEEDDDNDDDDIDDNDDLEEDIDDDDDNDGIDIETDNDENKEL